MAEAKGRKPHWNLAAMNPDNSSKGKVGAAWDNEDGSISIRLDPFVVLDATQDLKIKLFRSEGFEERQKERERKSATTPSSEGELVDRGLAEDDPPF